jgi:energy-coupling factor transporter ATP-binding protein EcfA2
LKSTPLTLTSICSSDAIDLAKYAAIISEGTKSGVINAILLRCHKIIINRCLGFRTLRYVLYRANNDLLQKVSVLPEKKPFKGTYISASCYPFELLPFARSLPEHNPSLSDLIFSQPVEDYDYQLLFRYLQNQLMTEGRMYIPKDEVESIFPKAKDLILRYNREAYYQHATIQSRFDHYFIQKSENDFLGVIAILKSYLSKGISDFQALRNAGMLYLTTQLSAEKQEALTSMFSNDRVALVYGPAGSGKTTLLSSLSTIFHGKSCLFLANTYAALNNMRVQTEKDGFKANRYFFAVAAFVKRSTPCHYDAVFIDECSTISNEDCLKCLSLVSADCLVLVGDPQQIEAIEFGNWFSLAQKILPSRTQITLTEDHRSVEGSHLLKLWEDVRQEKIQDIYVDLETHHFCQPINASIFDRCASDQTILALNYDGVYGVNNLNSILQAGNPNPPVVWRQRIYKKNDPIVFTATRLFSTEIYNNLKGTIVGIDVQGKCIFFSVKIQANQMRVGSHFGFECLSSTPDGSAVIRFSREKPSQEYLDNDGDNRFLIPFQVAYAVSIHKAQGLEFDSVKVVITEEAGEHITKNIFYTAVTRSKRELCIYWSPEVQAKVLASAKTKQNNNYSILSAARLV